MDIRYITDPMGTITGVFIPIIEWERLQKAYNLPTDEPAPVSQQFQQSLTEALKKVKPQE